MIHLYTWKNKMIRSTPELDLQRKFLWKQTRSYTCFHQMERPMCIHGTKRIRYGGEKKRAKTAEQAEQTFDPTKISSLEGMYCLPRGQVESSSVFKVCDRCGFAEMY